MFEGLKVRQSMWTFGIKGGEQFWLGLDIQEPNDEGILDYCQEFGFFTGDGEMIKGF